MYEALLFYQLALVGYNGILVRHKTATRSKYLGHQRLGGQTSRYAGHKDKLGKYEVLSESMGKYEDKLGEYEVLSPALGRCALGNLNRWRQIKQGTASQQEE